MMSSSADLGSFICSFLGVDRDAWPKASAAETHHKHIACIKDCFALVVIIAGFSYLGDHSTPFENMPEVCQRDMIFVRKHYVTHAFVLCGWHRIRLGQKSSGYHFF